MIEIIKFRGIQKLTVSEFSSINVIVGDNNSGKTTFLELILCGVGSNGKFAYFVERHRVNSIIIDEDIASLMVVTDRDEASDANVRRVINSSLEKVSVDVDQWKKNEIKDLYGLTKIVNTYLLIIPANEKGALEKVIIDALNDIPEETALIHEVVQFIDSLKGSLVPELNQTNKANKATVGTFFSVRYPKDAMIGVLMEKYGWYLLLCIC